MLCLGVLENKESFRMWGIKEMVQGLNVAF